MIQMIKDFFDYFRGLKIIYKNRADLINENKKFKRYCHNCNNVKINKRYDNFGDLPLLGRRYKLGDSKNWDMP